MTSEGEEAPYQVTGLRKVEVSINYNCHRPHRATELLEKVVETLNKLYASEAPLTPGKQPFLVSAIVIDIYRGDADIYLRPND